MNTGRSGRVTGNTGALTHPRQPISRCVKSNLGAVCPPVTRYPANCTWRFTCIYLSNSSAVNYKISFCVFVYRRFTYTLEMFEIIWPVCLKMTGANGIKSLDHRLTVMLNSRSQGATFAPQQR